MRNKIFMFVHLYPLQISTWILKHKMTNLAFKEIGYFGLLFHIRVGGRETLDT